jgi:hypothetical protein
MGSVDEWFLGEAFFYVVVEAVLSSSMVGIDWKGIRFFSL